jgi:hypothetical protein
MEQAFRGASTPCQGEGTITRSQLDSTYRRGSGCTLISASDVASTLHEHRLVRINRVKRASLRAFPLQYRYDMSSVLCL